MAAPNIKEEIRKLVELQGLDKKIFDLSREKARLPSMLEELKKEFEDKKAHLKSLEDNRQKLLLKQKEKEGELAAKEDNIKKTQGQLGQLKTNKEYQAKMTEIEGLKADKSIIEEIILKTMDDFDAAKNDITAEKKTVDIEENLYAGKKSAALEQAKKIDDELRDAQEKRRIIAGGVDKKILERYDHILQGRDGLALVKVTDHSCNGCFMKVPHQVINEIKMHERLIMCETCSRILYLEEDIAS